MTTPPSSHPRNILLVQNDCTKQRTDRRVTCLLRSTSPLIVSLPAEMNGWQPLRSSEKDQRVAPMPQVWRSSDRVGPTTTNGRFAGADHDRPCMCTPSRLRLESNLSRLRSRPTWQWRWPTRSEARCALSHSLVTAGWLPNGSSSLVQTGDVRQATC